MRAAAASGAGCASRRPCSSTSIGLTLAERTGFGLGIEGPARAGGQGLDGRDVAIAGLGNRLDEPRLSGVVAQRLARIPDALHERIIGHRGVLPELGDEFVLADDPIAVINEVEEDLKAAGAQIHVRAVAPDDAFCGPNLDFDRSEDERLRTAAHRRLSRGAASDKTESLHGSRISKLSCFCRDRRVREWIGARIMILGEGGGPKPYTGGYVCLEL